MFKMYLEELEEIPEYSKEEQDELYKKLLNGDESVIHTISNMWLKSVLDMAKKLAVTKEGFEDVVQEGNMALFMHLTELCGAGEKENIEDEILEVIEAAMKECIRDQTGESENENAMVGKVSLVSRAVEHLKSQNGTDPSAQELSEYTSVPADELSSILELLKKATQKDDKNSRSEGNRESNNTSTDSNNDKNRDNHSNNNSNNNYENRNVDSDKLSNTDTNNDDSNKSNSERNLLQDGSNNNDKNNSSERDLLYDNSQHSDANNINNDKNSNLEDIVVDANDNNTDISSSNLREKNPNIAIDNDSSVDNGNSNANSSNSNNNDQESPSFDNSASTRDLLGENQLMIANDQTDEANIDQNKNIETPPNIDLSDLTKNNENNHEISDEEKIAEMERREKQRIKHNIKLKAVAAIPIIGMDLNQRMANKTTMENTAKKKLLNETNKVLNQNKGQSMTLNQAMNQAIDNITANSRAKDKKYETKRLEQAKQKVTKFDVNTNIDLIKEAKKKKLNNNNNNNK